MWSCGIVLLFITCSEMDIFSVGDPIFHTKMLTFHRREPFDLEASYKSPKQLPTSNPSIGKDITESIIVSYLIK